MPTRPTTLSSTPVTVSRAAPWRPHRTSNDARESGTSSARLRFLASSNSHTWRPSRNSRMPQCSGMSLEATVRIRERPGDFDRLAEGHCSAGCLFFCQSFRSEHVDEPSLEEDDELEVVCGWRELTNFVQPNACSPKTGSGSRVFGFGRRRHPGGREGELVVRRPGGVHQQFDYLTKRGPRLAPAVDAEGSPAQT